MVDSKKSIKPYLFLFALLSAVIMLSGCVETKPREGVLDTIPVQITTGSDVCSGWNESTCGAFLKEKRIEYSDFKCEGPAGPLDRKLTDFTYSLNPEAGWICVEEKGELSFSYSNTVSGYDTIGRASSFTSKNSIQFSLPLKSLKDVKTSCSLNDYGSTIGFGYLYAVVLFGGQTWSPYTSWYVGQERCDKGWTGYGRVDHSPIMIESTSSMFSNDTVSVDITVGGSTPSMCKECHKSDFKTKCSWRAWNDVLSNGYIFTCTLVPTYSTAWRCFNPYTGEDYKFVNCSSSEYSSFQGGSAYLDNDTPYSELSNYLQSYYGTYSFDPLTGKTEMSGNIQVPFFMLGQGPTFTDYEEAKKLCTPYKEQIVNISLGNTTFDPPILTVPKMEVCLYNDDSKEHRVDLVNLQNQQIVRQFLLLQGQSVCFKPNEGYYHLKDSNKDYASLSIISSTSTSQIYVGSRIVPNYTLVTDGGFVNFSLLERVSHNLTIRSLDLLPDAFEKNITLNLTNKFSTIDSPPSGEYEIRDNSTGQKGNLFVQSVTNKFIFKSDGSVVPNYTIYRPLGDTVCFTSENSGVSLNISRLSYSESGNEWITLYIDEPLPIQPAYCCIQGVLAGKYQAISNDGRLINWSIGTGKPSVTINLQSIGFEPEILDSEPGTKVCWVNPSTATRDITTMFSKTGKIFFSASIPPLSDDVCNPTADEEGSYLTSFVSPPVSVVQVLNLKELSSKEITITAGGFDTTYLSVEPGQQVCWINADTNNHTLVKENGDSVLLEPNQIDCISSAQVKDASFFYRQLDSSEIYSYVVGLEGPGIVLTTKGPMPAYEFIQISNETYLQKFRIINLQTKTSQVYELKQVALSSNGTSLAYSFNNTVFVTNISTFTTARLIVQNNDNKTHAISVILNGVEKDKVNVSGGQYHIFDLNNNVVLIDNTIKDALVSANITNQTMIEAYSEIAVNIIGPKEMILAPSGRDNSEMTLSAPSEIMVSTLVENNTGSQFFLSFNELTGTTLTNPLNNITLDLPVQVVHGDLSSETLSSMRAYADEGAMSMIIPSFQNVTVKISSAVFTPPESFIPAGSTITITNKDVITHTVDITKNTGGSVTFNSSSLSLLESFQTSNTPKNTTFYIHDQESNLNGNITVVAYDAKIGVSSIPVSPQVGMVAVGGPVKFNNYDTDSEVTVEISLTSTTGEKSLYALTVPKYSSGIAGQAVWIPDTAGDAVYSVRNSSAIIGSGNISVRNSVINVSILNGQFGVKSLSIDHESEVCFLPNSVRNITITNIDTGEVVAKTNILPIGVPVGNSDRCSIVYNCSANSGVSNTVSCGGQVTEGDTDSTCNYWFTDPTSACKLNISWNCGVKSEYSSDLACASDYSIDTNPLLEGIQPQCMFQALTEGDACKGSCTIKDPNGGSKVTCTNVGDSCAFAYNTTTFSNGVGYTTTSDPFCRVFANGCVQTGAYMDVGCQYDAATKRCYYTPSPVASGESTSTSVDNRFCDVSENILGELYKTCCRTENWVPGTCGCMSGDSPLNPSTSYSVSCVLQYSYVRCRCSSGAVCYGPAYRWYKYNCYGQKVSEGTGCACCPGTTIPSPACGTTFNMQCPYYAPKPVIGCSLRTGGSSIFSSSVPSSCTLDTSKYVCTYSSVSAPYACTNEANCPCQVCSKKTEYSALANIECNSVGGRCTVSSVLNQDYGTYCSYSKSSTCAPLPGLENKVYCGINTTAQLCTIPQIKENSDDQGYCDLKPASCVSKSTGTNCSFNSASQACDAITSEQFCFTPASTYVVQDVESGDTLTVEGYDRYTPLEIDIQKAELTPAVVTTSPLSEVCFISLDGKQHALTVPSQINNGEDIIVDSASKCLQFPYNFEPWIVRLKDNPEIGAQITSIKEDVEIVVKSQMFDPSDIILRPGAALTFVNKDNVEHVLLKSSTLATSGSLKLTSFQPLVFSSLFNLKGSLVWIDDIFCSDDSDCARGSFCDIEGRCHPVVQCTKESDCPSGSTCLNETCIVLKSCRTLADCNSSELCLSGKCVSASSSCSNVTDCPANSICVLNATSGAGNCISIGTCASSSDCLSGLVCYDGFCTADKTCTTNADCSVNFACIGGRCIEPHTSLCESDSNCTEGLSCVVPWGFEEDNITSCIGQPCSSNSNCMDIYGSDSNTTCIRYDLDSELGDCTSYDIVESLMFPDSSYCADAAFLGGQCIMPKPCSSNADCPTISGNKMLCSEGYCKITLKCSSNADCPSNNICSEGYCTSLSTVMCLKSEDCSEGKICSDAKCVVKKECSSTPYCTGVQAGSACTNESSSSPSFCKSSPVCFSDATCPAFNQCIGGQCVSYARTSCDYMQYGTEDTQYNFSFKLPASTFKAYITYSFNDNGKVILNNQTIVPTTKNNCNYKGVLVDSWSVPDTAKLPLSLVKLGSEENQLSITTCSCSGDKGFDITLSYQYVDPTGITQEGKVVVGPNSQSTINVPFASQEFAYVDEKSMNALPVTIKPCSGYDLSSIALSIGKYERLDYSSIECDSGKIEECKDYNPYGPATVTFVSSEAGLDLTDSEELSCALSQIKTIKTYCPNCTTVLNVGELNITQLNAILLEANRTNITSRIDVIGYDVFINDYPTCDFAEIMNSIVNSSKLALYNYSKPSILMRFGFKGGDSVYAACNWTEESIVNAYTDFYGLWIPILAGSGVLGTAQYCLTDPCPSLDFYGLLTEGKTNKAYTDAWFKEGCGRYYYNAEGLSFTTFSMKETNYSMCDPSRMLALLQTAQCAVGKYTLKSGTG